MPRSATSSPTRAYHHGDLREALIEASETLLAERGVEGFTLREVARRAGVSPAAPAHHFGDVRGLLTAVAIRAFEELTARLTAADLAAGADRRARLRAQGEAYVRFALARPGRFGLMFAVARLDGENLELQRQGDAAFAVLERAVAGRAAGEGTGCGPSASPRTSLKRISTASGPALWNWPSSASRAKPCTSDQARAIAAACSSDNACS